MRQQSTSSIRPICLNTICQEWEMVRFEFQPKTERVNMRLPKSLLDAVRASAQKAGIPYQRFIRQALEAAVGSRRAR